MKKYKRIFAALLCVLSIISASNIPAFAAGRIDTEREVSLTISYQNEKTPLTGVKFDIYLVATVNEYGEITVTDDFKQFNVNIEGEKDEAWSTLASTLEGYALWSGIKPADNGRTDKQGIIRFPNKAETLKQGLYLVIAESHTQGGYIYEAVPFMVMLPSLDKEVNDWNYDVKAYPKHNSKPSGPTVISLSRKALKVWDDNGHKSERPKEITVCLLRDGKVYSTVVLNESNNWKYTWNDLDNSHKWNVVEKDPGDYKVTVTQEGVTFVITNTYSGNSPINPDNPSGPKLPQTGQMWWPVPVLVTMGLALIIFGLWRRKGAGYEK